MQIYLTIVTLFDIIEKLIIKIAFRDVAQLVARVLWEHDVAGSNPVIPTKKPS